MTRAARRRRTATLLGNRGNAVRTVEVSPIDTRHATLLAVRTGFIARYLTGARYSHVALRIGKLTYCFRGNRVQIYLNAQYPGRYDEFCIAGMLYPAAVHLMVWCRSQRHVERHTTALLPAMLRYWWTKDRWLDLSQAAGVQLLRRALAAIGYQVPVACWTPDLLTQYHVFGPMEPAKAA